MHYKSVEWASKWNCVPLFLPMKKRTLWWSAVHFILSYILTSAFLRRRTLTTFSQPLWAAIISGVMRAGLDWWFTSAPLLISSSTICASPDFWTEKRTFMKIAWIRLICPSFLPILEAYWMGASEPIEFRFRSSRLWMRSFPVTKTREFILFGFWFFSPFHREKESKFHSAVNTFSG